MHVEELTLSNAAGGTSLGLSGNAELGAGRHTLSLTAALAQDLARLSLAPEHFRGRGTLALEASVASPGSLLLRVGAP